MLRPLIKALVHGDAYWLRRSFLWPEAKQKAGMLRRVQKQYGQPLFVETGTYLGDTPLALRDCFDSIWTIEIDAALHAAAAERLAPHKNIICLLGSASACLRQLAPVLTKPTIFWLDSHYSGPGTGRGDCDLPVLEELAIIRNFCPAGSAVVIDDVSSYCAASGTSKLSDILSSLENIDPKWTFFFDYDMLFALPIEPTPHSFWTKIIYHLAIR